MSEFKLPPFVREPITRTKSVALSDTEDWGHQFINPRVFWDQGYTGESVVVFVIDTGIDDTHPDLQGQVIHRKDFTGENISTKDPNGHGTWCASRIAAKQNFNGVVGIAPGCKLVDLRVLNSSGTGSNANIAAAFKYSADVVLPEPYENWRRVCSVSLGGPSSTVELKKSVEYNTSEGAFNIIAAGNEGHLSGRDTIGYPAAYKDQAIAVGALAQSGDIANYSSIGEALDVVAPGSALLGAVPGGGYELFSGTSMATPGVAGLTALILQKHGEHIKTQLDLEYYLRQYATDMGDLGWDKYTGAGATVATNYVDAVPDHKEPEEPETPEIPTPNLPIWAWVAIGTALILAAIFLS